LGQSDARTHRTPKALGAKCVQDAVPLFRASFRSAHASSRRFCFAMITRARLDVLRQNHAAVDAEGTINIKTTMPNKI